MICDHDCLNCKFDDCILPEDAEESGDEIRLSDELDREAWRSNCEADYDGEMARRKRVATVKRRYYVRHRAACLSYVRDYNERTRERRNDYAREFYQQNRERINERRRELRRLNRKIAKLSKNKKGR